MQFLLQVRDPPRGRRIHIVFLGHANDAFIRSGPVFQEQNGNQAGILFFTPGDGAYRQVDDFASGRTVHGDSRVGYGNMFRPAAVQGGGSHQT